jgi:hypothetical protein
LIHNSGDYQQDLDIDVAVVCGVGAGSPSDVARAWLNCQIPSLGANLGPLRRRERAKSFAEAVRPRKSLEALGGAGNDLVYVPSMELNNLPQFDMGPPV